MASEVKILIKNRREFQRVLREYKKVSSRTWPEIINSKLKFIAYGALKTTKHASASKLHRFFGQTASEIAKKNKRGEITKFYKNPQKRRVYGQDTILHRLVRVQRKKKGERPLTDAELDKEVKKIRSSRLKGIGYIKSGWLWIAKNLNKDKTARGATDKSGAKGVKIFGKKKGFVKTAKASKYVFALKGRMWIRSLQKMSKNSVRKGNPKPVAERGLAKAFAKEAASMLQYMANKQKPINKRYSR